MKEYVIEYQNVILCMKYQEVVNDKTFAEEIVYRANKLSNLTDTIVKMKEKK